MIDKEAFYNNIISELRNESLILPTLPEVALQVREAINNPNITAQSLANIIITDTALSARLLKVANSVFYRGSLPVETVQMAISRLGLKMVSNFVTSLVMEQMLKSSSSHLDKRLQELWQQSTEVAAISQVLTAKHPRLKTDEAMLAGLIHKIGILPILMKAEDFPDLLQETEGGKVLDDIIEQLHPRIGTAILKSWNFTDEFIAVPAEYGDLSRDSINGPDLVDVVQVAVLQNDKNLDKVNESDHFYDIPAFAKLGIEVGLSVTELDENSEEYAEAMALFNNI